MPPVIKDSDTLTAVPENPGRSGSAGASASDSAVKPQPVALEIPITVNGARTVEGSDKREPFSESTKTVMVFGSGAVIKLASNMAPGQLLFLTNERTKKEVVCQVVKSKNYRNVSGYVELEFTEPAVGFWGMRFPSDRIGPSPQAAPEATRPAMAGNGSSAPSRPAAQKTEQPLAKSTPVAAKPPIAAPVSAKPAPLASKSSVVPPAAPIATSLGSDEPLVEPWLKKRGPVSKVPAAQSSVVSPAPSAKSAEPEPIHPMEPNFELARPSDKAASLFAPAEASSTLPKVDLSTLAPFFEVKPAANEEPPAPPKAQAASEPGTEELKKHTARLQDELGKMQFAETTSSSKLKAKAEKPEAEKPVVPEMEVPSFPLTEQSIATLKTELVHENAVRLVENPEPSNTPPVLAELSRLDEPVKVEPAAAIPALESLEQEEMKIPAWLEPLARGASAPSSTKEPVLREKAKRRAEQPTLEEMTAPLVAPAEKGHVAESRVPQFGSALPFEETKRVKESAPKKSGKGMLFVGLAAGVLLLAGGGWWYMNQQSAGIHANTAAVQAADVSTAARDLQTNSSKEAAPVAMQPSSEEASPVKPGPANANLNPPNHSASAHASSVAAGSSSTAARNPQANSHSSNSGSVVTDGASGTPEPVAATEKKPVLGEVHLAAPKISQKRTVQGGAAPDAAISSSEDQPEANADSLGASLGTESNQPAAPAAPVAVGGDVKQAKLISSVPPEYPALAKAQHVSGGVTIDALIDTNGRVTKMKVISGPTLLQQAAMDALRQWKYQPASLDGKAVPMHLTITIQFRLQE
ncbi:MAG TPA: TonB family protein [Candidatus Acidoferrum sp.]